MSTTFGTSLARSRSLRKPAPPAAGSQLGQQLQQPQQQQSQQDVAPRAEARNASPSRLPVKGLSRAMSVSTASTISSAAANGANGAAAGEPTSAAASAPKKAPRPISGIFGRSNSTRQAPPATATSTEPNRPPITTRQRQGTIPTTRPTSSSGVPSATATKPKPTATHSRTKSSATTLTGATILRPPSQTSTASAATTSGAVDRSRPPVTSGNATRQPLGHRRQASASTTATTTSTISAGSSAASTKPVAKPPAPTAAEGPRSMAPPPRPTAQLQQQQQAPQPRLLRPAFSTLQQHYSPAKSLAPKPLTASFLAPPSPSKLPANVALSAETARLQTELLQLHLLHRDAELVASQWRASARERLGARFAALAADSEDVGRAEAGLAEAENAAALRAWGEMGGLGLEEKVQVLDGVLGGVWSLGEPQAGRYARVVRRFERWAERMVEIVEARQGGGGGIARGQGATLLLDGDELVFVGELDAAWKDDCEGLARKLDIWRRQLRELGDVPGVDQQQPGGQASSLARILAACRGLVHDMLAELSVMEQIERDAVAQEAEWIRAMSRTVDEDGALDDTPRAGAIWRVL